MLYSQTKKSLCQQVPQKVKKLLTVLATSTSMMDKKTEEKLEQLPYI